jgi:hypothetical protein
MRPFSKRCRRLRERALAMDEGDRCQRQDREHEQRQPLALVAARGAEGETLATGRAELHIAMHERPFDGPLALSSEPIRLARVAMEAGTR